LWLFFITICFILSNAKLEPLQCADGHNAAHEMAEDFFCFFYEDISAAAPVFQEGVGALGSSAFVIAYGFCWF